MGTSLTMSLSSYYRLFFIILLAALSTWCFLSLGEGTTPTRGGLLYDNPHAVLEGLSVPVFAIIFPQFHRFALNDHLWGEGYTDWEKVRHAAGLPGEARSARQLSVATPLDGYYDQSDIAVLRRQAHQARAAGVHGFMFYHYWFNDSAVMDAPLNALLADRTWDMPFYFSWANEPWTRNWDGGDREVLIDQDYDEASWGPHFQWLLRFFRHPAYMQRRGKPVLAIYRLCDIAGGAGLLYRQAQLEAMLREWQVLAQLAGFQGLYIVQTMGAFACNSLPLKPFASGIFEFSVFRESSSLKLLTPTPDYHYGVSGGWNNRPRQPELGTLSLVHPVVFKRDMRVALDLAARAGTFVIINAWNEWSEGAAIEPSNERGGSFLRALRDAIDEHRAGLPLFVVPRASQSDTAIFRPLLLPPSQPSTVCILIDTQGTPQSDDGENALRRTLDSLVGLTHKDWRAVVLVANVTFATTISKTYVTHRITVEIGDVGVGPSSLAHCDRGGLGSSLAEWLLILQAGTLVTPSALDALPSSVAAVALATSEPAAAASPFTQACCADAEPVCLPRVADASNPLDLLVLHASVLPLLPLNESALVQRSALRTLGLPVAEHSYGTCTVHVRPSAAFLCRLRGGVFVYSGTAHQRQPTCMLREGSSVARLPEPTTVFNWRSFYQESGCYCVD